MARLVKSPDARFLVLATDEDGIHVYLLRRSGQLSSKQAEEVFDSLVKRNEWKPFQKVEVFGLNADEDLKKLTIL